MSIHAPGRQVKGILNSNDLTTVAPIPLFEVSTGAAYTLGTNDVLILYALIVNNGDSASIVTVFADTDGDGAVDSGEEIYGKSLTANQTGGFAYTRGLALPKSTGLKALAVGASANTKIVALFDVQE